ncbi:MAG TPA: TIGR03545 family protein [Spirochaetota bacterium]|nr:TIGR03545 family protein [Spirochaetota bacterium]HOS33105.1 TIGR03545 family protein [Spirochaetota bacterium]HOS56398.1 TIGR03545 family protein [Spirochaetota bacterium]HPK61999.1 TIGR03545 family protein [Spirochaetota bacterium]HQF77064.1 TIGR03545 family protein [Spirochaetota bacterium]
MRIINLIIISVVTIAAITFNVIFASPIAKNLIEKYASAAVGARVEMRELKVDIFALSVVGKDLQVTNPGNTMKNLFEVARFAFKLDLLAALEKKILIEEASIENVRIGTARKYDGKIKIDPKKKKITINNPISNLSDYKFDFKNENIFNTDINEMIKSLDVEKYIKGDLKTISEINKLKTQGTELSQKWYKTITETRYDKDAIQFAEEIKKINFNYTPDVSSIAKIQSDIQTILKVKEKTEAIIKDIDSKKNEFIADYNAMETSVRELEKVTREELNEILGKMNLKEISFDDIGSLIFADGFMNNVDKITSSFYKIRSFVPNNRGKVKKVKTKEKKVKKKFVFGQRGYDVFFPDYTTYPDYHIKKISVSASGEGSDIKNFPTVSGSIYDIVSNQDLIQKPLRIETKVILPILEDLSLSLNASFDRRDGKFLDFYNVAADNIPIKNLNFGGLYGAPKKLLDSDGKIDGIVEVGNDVFKTKFDMNLNNIDFEFDETQTLNEFSQILKEIFQSVKHLNMGVDFSVLNGKPSLHISSNLDKILYENINRIFMQKLLKFKTDFEKRFNSYISGPKKELLSQISADKLKNLSFLNDKNKIVIEQFKFSETKLKEAQTKLESIKKQIEENTKNKLIDETTKRLKKIF